MMSDTTLSRPEVVSGHTDVIYSTSVCHILAVRKSTLLPIDTIIKGKMMMSDTTLSRPEVVSGHTDVIYSTSVCHILAVRKSTLLPIDTIIRHQVSDIS